MDLDCDCDQWHCSPVLDRKSYDRVRRSLMLNHFKWDSQVGDVNTLAPFALILPHHTWQQLATLAEQLTAEAFSVEAELQERPELWKSLGLPRRVLKALRQEAAWTPAAARVFRFDFHPTPNGWRISEANSDVPGGYTEASNFSRQMSDHIPGTVTAGDPADRLVDVLTKPVKAGGHIAFLSAPGYLEDQQITTYLAKLVQQRGYITHLAHPRQIEWVEGLAHLRSSEYDGALDAILRFYQGEWMERLRNDRQWRTFFRGGKTPVCHPASALFVESKRFPLLWSQLSTSLPTWNALLPETCHPWAVNWLRKADWLLKTAYCNTGDAVTMRGVAPRHTYFWTVVSALLSPAQWVAQRRFDASAIATPIGVMYPCLGVYTVNGVAAGIYGRMAAKPLIDYSAIDLAVLIQTESL